MADPDVDGPVAIPETIICVSDAGDTGCGDVAGHAESRRADRVEPAVEPRAALASRRAGLLRMVLVDMVAPVVVFQLCHAAGASDVAALVASCLPPAVGVLHTWRRRGGLEVVGVTVLAGIVLSIALGAWSDNPKAVLLQSAAFTAVFGLCCVVSLMFPKPLMLRFGIALHGGPETASGSQLATDFVKHPAARHFWRVVTAVWGIAYLADAGVRAWAVQRLSASTSLTLNRTLPWLLTALLFTWAFHWASRLEHERDF
ncbi:VC0807 family protein [Nocardioides sp. CER19]|uniref:VC0807 family protein n=1 Tax=Nocardioides sp. CER19 TaxID=3038538 RepID=UPI002446BC01|nr:VC0807 family protein [Nocardioides sp. CER19]MDH2415277.1 hypothetical protein [Nocardioides sp. CER19]